MLEQKIQEIANEIFLKIGINSQLRYMRQGGGDPIAGMVTIRSGRLARSILGVGAREREGINEVRYEGDSIIFSKGTDVPYAALHEYGGTRQVTSNMRSFFWAKFFETNEGKWMAFAKSSSLVFPARPYLRPAVDDSLPEIREIIRTKIGEFVNLRIKEIVHGATK